MLLYVVTFLWDVFPLASYHLSSACVWSAACTKCGLLENTGDMIGPSCRNTRMNKHLERFHLLFFFNFSDMIFKQSDSSIRTFLQYLGLLRFSIKVFTCAFFKWWIGYWCTTAYTSQHEENLFSFILKKGKSSWRGPQKWKADFLAWSVNASNLNHLKLQKYFEDPVNNQEVFKLTK